MHVPPAFGNHKVPPVGAEERTMSPVMGLNVLVGGGVGEAIQFSELDKVNFG